MPPPEKLFVDAEPKSPRQSPQRLPMHIRLPSAHARQSPDTSTTLPQATSSPGVLHGHPSSGVRHAVSAGGGRLSPLVAAGLESPHAIGATAHQPITPI